jgi:chromosome segregation ATPase
VQIVESQAWDVQKTIEVEIKSLSKEREVSLAKVEEVSRSADQIKEIFHTLESKFEYFEEMSKSINYTIENYSSKITKIRSDYELFTEAIKKDFSGITKFRDKLMDKLRDLGGILCSLV